MEVVWAALGTALIIALSEVMEALDNNLVMEIALEEWAVIGETRV